MAPHPRTRRGGLGLVAGLQRRCRGTPRHLHHRLRRLLASGGGAQRRPRLSPFDGVSLPLTPGRQHDRVPQSLLHCGARRIRGGRRDDRAADLLHRAADPRGRDLRERRHAATPHEHAAPHDAPPPRRKPPRPGPRRTASSASPTPRSPTSSPAVGFALLLAAASEFAGGIAGWRAGLYWGFAGFRRLHAGAGPRPAARAARHAGGRPPAPAALVDPLRPRHRRGAGADRLRPLRGRWRRWAPRS